MDFRAGYMAGVVGAAWALDASFVRIVVLLVLAGIGLGAYALAIRVVRRRRRPPIRRVEFSDHFGVVQRVPLNPPLPADERITRFGIMTEERL